MRSSSSHPGHLVAGGGATAAGFGTALHLGIVAHLLAIGSAGLIHLGTRAAGLSMKLGSAQHEVRRGNAHLGAILEECNVGWFGVHATLRQAVSERACADAVAIQTVLDTLLHTLHWLVGGTLHTIRLHRSRTYFALITKYCPSTLGRIYA